MRKIAILLAAPALAVAQTPVASPRIEITFAKAAHAEAITGRVYVAISKTSDANRTPIQQAGETGVPLFAVNIDQLAPGAVATIDAKTFGHPVQNLRDIPAGEYWVQPFVNIYTKFARADGHTVWLHMDQWEGQHWQRSPGNLYGDPIKITFDPKLSKPVRLVADKVVPALALPADNEHVKRIKIQSQILTKWWGHPIFLGATVLLPKDYDRHPDAKYPIIYDQGHFSLGAPGGYGQTGGRGGQRGGDFTSYWDADGTPRMILVTLQHPSPYYDDSYGVNSANNGPFGDAIIQELIPEIETKFRAIREPWARLLTGGSTGGWIALAHQVFYPDFYGGTWALCPDGVDFRYHQIVNVYDDANAYWIDKGWTKIDRPDSRRPDGNIQTMMKDENWYELVQGDHSRSSGQWDIWEATYGPVGADGYPAPIWDKRTGVIDTHVAAYWKEHYDLRNILETNWPTLGPKVANKINVYVGDADTYFLNMGVHMLENFLKSAKNPAWTGEVVFQPMAPHCWGPSLRELIPKMAAQIDKSAPGGADVKSWKY
ncbi:MAG TPA: alpha/beta hydrolase-fold protein [Gemmatimonadaceae bacterium]|nr:alpha/beta hydrolase-fold protein [Gemmatimonadaceae bacterium]